MLKILSYNLLIISFVLISCAKKDESSTTTSSTTYATSKSGVTASGSITLGSDTVSGTYATECIGASSLTKPSDTTHVGYLIVITGSSTFTKERNFYTDSACTSLSLGWYDNYTSVVVGDASGSDYKVTYTQANRTFFAKTTGGETYIESVFEGLDVTVGTASVQTVGVPYYNLIKVSGTNFYFGEGEILAYPSELNSITYVKQ